MKYKKGYMLSYNTLAFLYGCYMFIGCYYIYE